MIWILAIILLVLWVLGLVSSFTMGGLIHALLLLAGVAVLFQVYRGKNLATDQVPR